MLYSGCDITNAEEETKKAVILDEFMDINLISQSLEDLLPRRPANDLTTAECRISNVIIPKTVLDGGAQPSFIFKKLAQRLGLRIDKTFLEGVSTDL